MGGDWPSLLLHYLDDLLSPSIIGRNAELSPRLAPTVEANQGHLHAPAWRRVSTVAAKGISRPPAPAQGVICASVKAVVPEPGAFTLTYVTGAAVTSQLLFQELFDIVQHLLSGSASGGATETSVTTTAVDNHEVLGGGHFLGNAAAWERVWVRTQVRGARGGDGLLC
eukprot:gene6472-3108_t